MKILIIIGTILGVMAISYNFLINYLSKQAANPDGLIGEFVTKIWSSYFDDLSEWSINLTNVSNGSKILDVGYGGGSNIKNLINLNKDVKVYGIDISEESYKTASSLNDEAIEKKKVELMIGDVANMVYEDELFDYIFAIQTHMYWKELDAGFIECFRTLNEGGTLIITSEVDKIDYHLPKYQDANKFKNYLLIIGFEKVVIKNEGNYVAFICEK